MALSRYKNGALNVHHVMADAPVIPVIVLHDVAHAVPLAQALVAGGIRMLELTLRTPQALACIAAIAEHVPQAIVGAGTVCRSADVKAALSAGARFMVSPGYTSELGTACQEADIALLPGVATASEIMQAHQDGYRAFKFFPAMAAGGIAMLQAWAGPFPQIKFCPTGGIHVGNARDFLALPNVVCVGGSWLTPAAAIAQSNWPEVERLARQAAALNSA